MKRREEKRREAKREIVLSSDEASHRDTHTLHHTVTSSHTHIIIHHHTITPPHPPPLTHPLTPSPLHLGLLADADPSSSAGHGGEPMQDGAHEHREPTEPVVMVSSWCVPIWCMPIWCVSTVIPRGAYDTPHRGGRRMSWREAWRRGEGATGECAGLAHHPPNTHHAPSTQYSIPNTQYPALSTQHPALTHQ